MSKDFDASLSDALDSVARAARSAGPEAAQIRGRKRTMRKRIALSTVSLVLVAAGATTAFKVADTSHDITPTMTHSASPNVTVSVSPTTAATNGTPTTGATGTSTSGSPASGSTSATPSGSTATSSSRIGDPHKVVTSAWLTASQMPFAGTFVWNSIPASSDSVQPLTSTIGYVPNDTSYQALTMCADPAQLLSRTTGAQIQGFETTPTSAGSHGADQYIFFFTNAKSAQQTYSWLQNQYSSSCLGIPSTGAQITQVASDGTSGMAWLSRKASSGLPDMPIYQREYFVQRGNTIAYVSFTSPQDLPTAYDDSSQLATIAAHMCIYGGACN